MRRRVAGGAGAFRRTSRRRNIRARWCRRARLAEGGLRDGARREAALVGVGGGEVPCCAAWAARRVARESERGARALRARAALSRAGEARLEASKTRASTARTRAAKSAAASVRVLDVHPSGAAPRRARRWSPCARRARRRVDAAVRLRRGGGVPGACGAAGGGAFYAARVERAVRAGGRGSSRGRAVRLARELRHRVGSACSWVRPAGAAPSGGSFYHGSLAAVPCRRARPVFACGTRVAVAQRLAAAVMRLRCAAASASPTRREKRATVRCRRQRLGACSSARTARSSSARRRRGAAQRARQRGRRVSSSSVVTRGSTARRGRWCLRVRRGAAARRRRRRRAIGSCARARWRRAARRRRRTAAASRRRRRRRAYLLCRVGGGDASRAVGERRARCACACRRARDGAARLEASNNARERYSAARRGCSSARVLDVQPWRDCGEARQWWRRRGSRAASRRRARARLATGVGGAPRGAGGGGVGVGASARRAHHLLQPCGASRQRAHGEGRRAAGPARREGARGGSRARRSARARAARATPPLGAGARRRARGGGDRRRRRRPPRRRRPRGGAPGVVPRRARAHCGTTARRLERLRARCPAPATARRRSRAARRGAGSVGAPRRTSAWLRVVGVAAARRAASVGGTVAVRCGRGGAPFGLPAGVGGERASPARALAEGGTRRRRTAQRLLVGV